MRAGRSHIVAVLAGLLLLALPLRRAFGEDHWIEVRSPHFRVVTNGSAGDGRRVVEEFEQIRYVIHYWFPTLRLDGVAPLLIVAAKDQATALRLQPGSKKLGGDYAAGEFYPGWAQNCAMVRLDSSTRGARETVYHEYVHSVFHLNAHRLPLWFDEGMAEFFAYTESMNHQFYVGVPTKRSEAFYSETAMIPIARLLDESYADYSRDESKMQMFYAESWALVHFLTFSPGMENGRKLAGFFDDLQNGDEQQVAFMHRFGPIEPLEGKFINYVFKQMYVAGVIPPPPELDRTAFPESALSPAEVAYQLGIFHVSEQDTAGGRALIEQAIALDSTLAGAHEEKGYLLYGEGKDPGARAEWKEAFALDATLYRARFAYLMSGTPFARQTAAEQQSSLDELRAILRVNPHFAAADAEIALLQWQRGRLDFALGSASEAVKLEPWRAGYRILSGQLLLAQGKGAEAARLARSTAQFAQGTDRAEAVALWMQVPAAARGEGPPLTYEVPSGGVVAQGSMASLSCKDSGKGGWLTVDFQPDGSIGPSVTNVDGAGAGQPDASSPATGLLRLTPKERVGVGSADTLYRGEQHMSPCDHSASRRALVAYTPGGPGVGTLLWLHVMDGLPRIGDSLPVPAASRPAMTDEAEPGGSTSTAAK